MTTTHDPEAARVPARLVVVGAGRAGGSLARAAEAAGIEVVVARRGEAQDAAAAAEAVLLCVPDSELERAAREVADVRPAPGLVGHVSGASSLDVLAPAREAGAATFSLHPLQTIPHPETDLGGAPCAVAGSDAEALGSARALAVALGLEPFAVPEEARAAYHAAAAIASNFLIALEESAAELLAAAGIERPREVLAPLVLRSVANWTEHGAAALTGPIARGDEETVARHLEALRETAPELLPLYEALAERTRAIARAEEGR